MVERQRGNNSRQKKAVIGEKRTVDGDGNNLRESEAVGTLESRDLAKGVNLAVLSTGVELSVGVSVDLHQLQVEVVVLSGDQNGDGARVVLERTG